MLSKTLVLVKSTSIALEIGSVQKGIHRKLSIVICEKFQGVQCVIVLLTRVFWESLHSNRVKHFNGLNLSP